MLMIAHTVHMHACMHPGCLSGFWHIAFLVGQVQGRAQVWVLSARFFDHAFVEVLIVQPEPPAFRVDWCVYPWWLVCFPNGAL